VFPGERGIEADAPKLKTCDQLRSLRVETFAFILSHHANSLSMHSYIKSPEQQTYISDQKIYHLLTIFKEAHLMS